MCVCVCVCITVTMSLGGFSCGADAQLYKLNNKHALILEKFSTADFSCGCI